MSAKPPGGFCLGQTSLLAGLPETLPEQPILPYVFLALQKPTSPLARLAFYLPGLGYPKIGYCSFSYRGYIFQPPCLPADKGVGEMEIIGKLSGKHIEEKVSKYGEVQGAVLLGMHRNLQWQKQRLQLAYPLSVAAFGLSVVSLGAVLWMLV